MIIPFCPEELFEINSNYKVTSFDNDILIIDSWYKNYEDIEKVLQNMSIPNWKKHSEGRNFIDYYDCRTSIPVNFPTNNLDKIISNYPKIISKFFGENVNLLKNNPFEFNYYKNNVKNVSSNLQHFPHIDFDFNCIIYLDSVASGGTAIYDVEYLENVEEYNLLHNVSKYNKHLIEAKPNRLAIFKGNRYHGGYINNHDDYFDKWRFNQVLFF
jgi:hypothetical protein